MMVTITIGLWGVGLRVGGLIINLYLGDLYFRIPQVGELAWNSLGLHMNRLPLPPRQEQRER
ncbi:MULTISPECIES: hypothetical protein [unclassified Halomonas]|uniref:hypothetical protein n=1 Tax=unclassified Halomonas TaxID=2609666 RepID=UPI0028875FBA|nr:MULTISPECIES: hypothetical protein [unclassified Halomonas]MDT0500321.1 hypothetical protein [Halomonas sp. PAR7]MDT0511182.1 hypothetical protein [Halomonas sp. LES1]MDT0590529.1 hypothetical protein [Halomonas sp. PAR8]